MTSTIAAVAIAGMGTFLIFMWMLSRVEMAKARARASAPDDVVAKLEGIAADTSSEVAQLKQRVQVLEKLVTDDDRRLADEIDRLRPSDGAR